MTTESQGSESLLDRRTVAALFVQPAGVYAAALDVEMWDEARDARLYAGPWPVVAHPPCARRSRLAGFVEHVHSYKRGDDGGCFEAALAAVRRFGGVLEHPAYSKAWDRYGLPEPIWRGGWTAGTCGGWTCYVEQGRYGELPVKKATWLYAYGVELPELLWGYTPNRDGDRPAGEHGGMDGWRDSWKDGPDDVIGWRPQLRRGWRINEPRDGAVAVVTAEQGRMRGNGASRTPIQFRDALLAIARTAKVIEAAAEPNDRRTLMPFGHRTKQGESLTDSPYAPNLSPTRPRPYRIVMVGDDGKVYRWSSGFKTRENAQREADRLNERPDEYRYGQTAEVRGPS